MANKIDVVFSEFESGSALKKIYEMQPEEVIDIISKSKLRGRGGAGFPTGRKWLFTSQVDSFPKYIVCNADEGEPGTFKDKVILEKQAAKVIEGMVIGAYAIKASKGFIYLRGEYAYLYNPLMKVMDNLKEQNLLGKDICQKKGFCFDIEIRLGFGAYVCGEETALIESLESKRGEPRNKPPYPVSNGYMQKPTVVNNVETLSLVPHIILNGYDWFNNIGTKESAGSKLFSVSGDCNKPGIYEFEFGITINELLKEVDAHNTKAVQIGASGACASKDDFDKPISFEGIPTGGSIMIFNESRDMYHILENFLEFFKEESCGQCVPCREGTKRMLEGLRKFGSRQGSSKTIQDLMNLADTMEIASKCGLGQSVPNSFRTIVSKFKDEIISR